MKICIKNITVLALIAALAFSACSGDDKVSYIQQEQGLNAGDITFYNADNAGFIMAYVPAKTFKIEIEDGDEAKIDAPFWIGETEVTYELWYRVLQWAALHSYTFSNNGRQGTDGAIGGNPYNMEPVTTVNWRDAIVWCNALTEWYNEKNGTDYTCVYYHDPDYTTPIRKSTNNGSVDDTNGSEDKPYIKAAADGNLDMAQCTATGFRLPRSLEWELAARYVDDIDNDGDITGPGEYYPGVFASGAMAAFNNGGATQAVAWYSENSLFSTHPVKELAKNALGLFDMSGNVSEWCFDWLPGYEWDGRVIRGGSWYDEDYALTVGTWSDQHPSLAENLYGFRIARNAYDE